MPGVLVLEVVCNETQFCTFGMELCSCLHSICLFFAVHVVRLLSGHVLVHSVNCELLFIQFSSQH